MKGSPDCPGAGEEFPDHSLNTGSESSLVQIEAKYVLAAIKIFKAAPILIRAADF